jgi:hypothetical protein
MNKYKDCSSIITSTKTKILIREKIMIKIVEDLIDGIAHKINQSKEKYSTILDKRIFNEACLDEVKRACDLEIFFPKDFGVFYQTVIAFLTVFVQNEPQTISEAITDKLVTENRKIGIPTPAPSKTSSKLPSKNASLSSTPLPAKKRKREDSLHETRSAQKTPQ